MLCPSCHTQNRDNAKFCKGCGLSFPAEQVETEQAQVAPGQAPAPTGQAEASVVAALPSTNANGGQDDISNAPTLILTPQEMTAYHARRWQQELAQEQEHSQQAPAAATDIADLPTMLIPLPAVSPANTTPANVEAASAAPNDAGTHPAVSSDVPAAATNATNGNAEAQVVASKDTPSPTNEEGSEAKPMTQSPADQNSQSTQPEATGNFPPLAVGTLMVGRYEITQVLSDEDQEHVYEVIDHQGYQHCWSCGSEQNAEGDEFCTNCGAALLNVTYIMHEYAPSQGKSDEAHVLSGAIANTFVDQGKTYIIELPQVSQNSFPNGVYLLVASESDAGTVRRGEPNEDSTLVLQLQRVHESLSAPSGVFIVADGLGGHDNGQVASRVAIAIIAEHVVRKLLARPLTAEKAGETPEAMDEDDIIEILKGAVEEANTVLCQKNQHDKTDMGSTLTGFMMVGDHAYIVNVGDSRTYMLRDGKLYQLTNDHSLVGQLVAGGLIEPDDVYTHPQRSQIFRSLGDKLNVQIDIFKQQVHPGDILLSCSDGLWEMVRNPQITEILTNATDPQMACRQLIEAANANGGEDNVSAVVVFVRS
jgi:serine/threonine protein phosphatase PrpC